jgi:hypothetical protein
VISAGSCITKTPSRVLDFDSFILENWLSLPKNTSSIAYVPLCWCSLQIATMESLMFGSGNSKNHDWEYHGDVAEKWT